MSAITPQQRRNMRGAALIIGVIASIAGSIGLVRSWPTTGWPSTRGTIVESSIRPVGRSGPDEADIIYRYEVDGRDFIRDRVAFMALRSQSDAKELVQRYSRGSEVSVYYDPGNPGRSVLEPGGVGTSIVALSIGLALLTAWRMFRRYAP